MAQTLTISFDSNESATPGSRITYVIQDASGEHRYQSTGNGDDITHVLVGDLRHCGRLPDQPDGS